MGWFRPPDRVGVFGGTAQKVGIAIRAGRFDEGRTRRIVRVLAVVVTPATWRVLPARYAPTPTMSAMSLHADGIVGLRKRSSARANARGVTGWFEGGANRNPDRSVKVNVRPPSET